MPLSLTILGCSSAAPTLTRHSSSQVLNVNERLFLIDCCEGAQIQMRKYQVKFQRIDHIFISHLHGDHYLGLMGLILTLHLLGRKKELHVYADAALKPVIDIQLEISKTTLQYPLVFHDIDSTVSTVIFEDKKIIVSTIPMEHSVPTVGFLFTEKPKERKIKKDVIEHMNIPVEEYEHIKAGADYIDKETGKIFKNETLTMPGKPSVSFAHCSDTGYTEKYLHQIQHVDLLYHEATFMHDKQINAREKLHCTTIDAANIAKKAEVKQLMIGHYSARYDDLNPLLEETKTVFPNTMLAEDGVVFKF